MLITRTSILTNLTRTLELPVTLTQLEEWRNTKKPIQNIMPQLTDSEREFIMTGVVDEEWDFLAATREG